MKVTTIIRNDDGEIVSEKTAVCPISDNDLENIIYAFSEIIHRLNAHNIEGAVKLASDMQRGIANKYRLERAFK